MTNPNNFSGTDSERMEKAICQAVQGDRILYIPERIKHFAGDRNYYLLDRAILLPENFTVIIENCTIMLSDSCRDNFFRTANCGYGITEVKEFSHIRILGRGNAVLCGAAHPRATGDANKKLMEKCYGTDGKIPTEKQTGDWRNIGILFAKVDSFEISNLLMKDYHCWAISMEKCSNGKIADITFDAVQNMNIDGENVRILNQDGVDIRKGCHHIDIENIYGRTGDDCVALTAYIPKSLSCGSLDYTEVSGMKMEELDMLHIHDISIRNIKAHSAGGHQIIRLLNSGGLKLYNILIDGVYDTSAESNVTDMVTLRIGDQNPAWGGSTPSGDTSNIHINNIVSRSHYAILIPGTLTDSSIRNVTDYNWEHNIIECPSGENSLKHVEIVNCVKAAIQ